MAVVKSGENGIKSKASLLKVLYYITNPEKVFMTSTVDCSGEPPEIYRQFEFSRQMQKRKKFDGDIRAHHYFQSFSPDDKVTPEQAHQIGTELMRKAAPNYQYVITTHIDRDHIHNHIVINSVNPLTGYKWHGNQDTLNHLRGISDGLCRKNGLSVIEEPGMNGIDRTTYQLAIKGKSWKVNLTKDLDEAINTCRGKDEFIDFMNKRGYLVRYTESHITFTKTGEKKGIRADTLSRQFGDRYSKASLEKAMGFHTITPPEVKASNKISNVKKPQDKVSKNFISEWQRYEKWTFKQKEKKAKRFAALDSLPPNILSNNRIEIFLLRLLLYVFLKNKKPRYFNNSRKYRTVKLKQPEQKINEVKHSYPVKTTGNIPRSELMGADGDNFYAKLDVLQLLKLSEANFFWCGKVNCKTNTANVTIKASNAKQLSELLDVPIKELQNQSVKITNSILYNELKRKAAQNNEKLLFKITDDDKLLILKNAEIRFTAFTKEDGKVNIAFLPEDENKINELLYPNPKAENAEESEHQRNNRIYNEIKTSAALKAEKPVYRVVTAEQLTLMKNIGVKIAVFKNGEKYNTAFLKQDEMVINQMLGVKKIQGMLR